MDELGAGQTAAGEVGSIFLTLAAGDGVCCLGGLPHNGFSVFRRTCQETAEQRGTCMNWNSLLFLLPGP